MADTQTVEYKDVRIVVIGGIWQVNATTTTGEIQVFGPFPTREDAELMARPLRISADAQTR